MFIYSYIILFRIFFILGGLFSISARINTWFHSGKNDITNRSDLGSIVLGIFHTIIHSQRNKSMWVITQCRHKIKKPFSNMKKRFPKLKRFPNKIVYDQMKWICWIDYIYRNTSYDVSNYDQVFNCLGEWIIWLGGIRVWGVRVIMWVGDI